MSKRFFVSVICVVMLAMPSAEVFGRGGGRGGGGGGRMGGGGARMGGGGGGFSGGARTSSPSYGGGGRSPQGNFGGGNFSGGARPNMGNMGSNMNAVNRGNMNNVGRGQGNMAGAGNLNRGGEFNNAGRNLGGAGQLGTGGANSIANRNIGGEGNRFSSPSQKQLSNFLGLPSDEGFGHAGQVAAGQGTRGNGNFDVNYGTKEGPRGGEAAGVTVTGPQGNTVGRAVGVGPNGGVAAARGVRGAEGGVAARGVAVGPNGGVAAGFVRTTPSGRYTAAVAVRGGYNHWGIYGRDWYVRYPGAWFAAGWAANAMWNTATWSTAAAYCGYIDQSPVYYDYGNTVVYEGDSVYVQGESAGTAEEYYNQATNIASAGTKAEAPSEGDWLPLGVFALTKAGETKSDVSIQLAVNKDGIIRGNYTDVVTNKNQLVQGSIDKQTQRVAFTVGDNTTNIVETGLYNLTKDEAPALIHFGTKRTEQWLLVRLKNDQAQPTN